MTEPDDLEQRMQDLHSEISGIPDNETIDAYETKITDLESRLNREQEARKKTGNIKRKQFFAKFGKSLTYFAITGAGAALIYLGFTSDYFQTVFDRYTVSNKTYISDTLKGAATGVVINGIWSFFHLLSEEKEYGLEATPKENTNSFLGAAIGGAIGGAITYNLIPDIFTDKGFLAKTANLLIRSSGSLVTGFIGYFAAKPDLEERFEKNLTNEQKASHFFKKAVDSSASESDQKRWYRKCVTYNPQHDAAWNNLGNLCEGEEKINCYTKAMQIEPDSEIYNGNIGWVCERNFAYHTAMDFLGRGDKKAKQEAENLKSRFPGLGSDIGETGATSIAESYVKKNRGSDKLFWQFQSVVEKGNDYLVQLKATTKSENLITISPTLAVVTVSKKGDFENYELQKQGNFKSIQEDTST